MFSSRQLAAIFFALAIAPAGCSSAPGQLGTLQTQNRSLLEQTKVQLAEIENLRSHARRLEDKLIEAEERLASVEPHPARGIADSGAIGGGSSIYDRHTVPSARAEVSMALRQRLQELATRHTAIEFDASSGTARLDTDRLFDPGDAVTRPEAEATLRDLAEVLRSDEAHGLKIMVVGHSDHQDLVGNQPGAKYRDDWELSMARALAVSAFLQRAGVPQNQLGVAGFGANQPLPSQATAADRGKNRRVEVHVISPDTPVVGWGPRGAGRY